jgi:hypothetical protein
VSDFLSEFEGTGDTPMGQAPLSLWLKRKKSSLKKEEPASIARYIKMLVQQSQTFKRRYLEPTWLGNLYYVYGAQHIELDAQGRYAPRQVSEDERRVCNIMLPRWMHFVAKGIAPKPQWTCIPWAETPEEVERARTGEKIIKSIHEDQSMLVKRLMVEMQRVLFGSAITKTFYDARGGALVQEMIPGVLGSGQPMMDPETGQQVMVPGKWRRDGEIVIRDVSIFDFHVQTSLTSPLLSEADWCAERASISVAELFRMYGIMAKPETVSLDPLRQLSVDFTRFMEGGQILGTDRRPNDCAYAIEYHEKPCEIEGFERGIIITIVNDKLVPIGDKDEPWAPQQFAPDSAKECGYAYEHYVNIPVIGRFHGHSVMTELKQPQDAINKDRMLLAVGRDLRAIPPIFVPIGCSIPEGAFTTGGPRQIKFTGQLPEVAKLGQLDQGLIEDAQQNLEDVDRISNLFGPSRGEMMGKSPWSADALQFFAEAEESDLMPQTFLAAYAYARAGQKVLQLVKQFYKKERLWILTGPSGEVDSFMAGAANIPERFKIMVQPDSALPLLKGALQQKLERQIQMGLYGEFQQDPIKQQNLRDAMQMPTPFDLMPPEVMAKRRAVRMLAALMATGELPPPRPSDNLQVLVDTWTARMQQPDFDKWPADVQAALTQGVQTLQAQLDQQKAKDTKDQFNLAIMQAVTEAVSRGKFRDAEAMLLATRGILERLDQEGKGAPEPPEPGDQPAEPAEPAPGPAPPPMQ